MGYADLFNRAGIDGGGVFKEFFTSLCKEAFDTDRGLWLANKKNELYPNPHAYATEGKLFSALFYCTSRKAPTEVFILSPQLELVSFHRTNCSKSIV